MVLTNVVVAGTRELVTVESTRLNQFADVLTGFGSEGELRTFMELGTTNMLTRLGPGFGFGLKALKKTLRWTLFGLKIAIVA